MMQCSMNHLRNRRGTFDQDSQQQQKGQSNDVETNEGNLAKSMVETNEEHESEFPPNRRRLPLELESEIFKCLKLPIQFKFLPGLGRGIYEMFGPKIRALMKSKKLLNPEGNNWKPNQDFTISPDGLCANTRQLPGDVFTKKGFPISGENCRTNHFPGAILYYYEITQLSSANNRSWSIIFCLTANGSTYGLYHSPNSYAMFNGIDRCVLSDTLYDFEWPKGAIKPKWNGQGDVMGCGLLLNPKNELAIFFTLNGILLGTQFPISPSVDHLFPTIYLRSGMSVVANFGDDPAKPFQYDIELCPGLQFEFK